MIFHSTSLGALSIGNSQYKGEVHLHHKSTLVNKSIQASPRSLTRKKMHTEKYETAGLSTGEVQ